MAVDLTNTPRHRAAPSATTRPTEVRREVQALRAVAVTLVLLFHLWPRRLTGGYVGVDVFFVISGFLITSHLLREAESSRTVRLGRFWARRARRLLPAAMLVLAVVGVAVLVVVPSTSWRQFFHEIAASSFYGENWYLAGQAVDYLGSANGASPVQHYWSLSAEEQFYLLWPVLILVVSWLARRATPRTWRVAVGVALGALTAATFVVSVLWTARMPATAYFVTPTRVWEFGAGGLLALLLGARRDLLPPWAASALSWTGLLAIGWSAVAFSGATPFPGSAAAVPVLGTAAVIAAGDPATRWSPGTIGRLAPVQRLGDLSYAVYLWHWPIITLVPFVTHMPLTAPVKLGIVAVTVLLAQATRVLVEDPVRFAPRLVASRPAWSITGAVVAAGLMVGASQAVVVVLDRRDAREAERLLVAVTDPCFGAAALDPAHDCASVRGSAATMTPAFAKTDTSNVADPAGGWQCETERGSSEIRRCVLGSAAAPTRTIAMLGDSHVEHFREPLRLVAEAHGWRIVTYFKSACSATGAEDVVLTVRPDDQQACAEFGRAAIAEIVADDSIDTVVVANVSSAYFQDDGAAPISASRYEQAWQPLLDAGKHVVAVADVPRTVGLDVPDCLAGSPGDETVCDARRAASFPPDAVADAAREMADRGVLLLDLSDRFCLADTCPARIGGVVVYSDSSHITRTYASTLAPDFEAALVRADD